MPQMSPMIWTFLLLMMLLMYMSIMSLLNSHSSPLLRNKKFPGNKSSMEW